MTIHNGFLKSFLNTAFSSSYIDIYIYSQCILFGGDISVSKAKKRLVFQNFSILLKKNLTDIKRYIS